MTNTAGVKHGQAVSTRPVVNVAATPAVYTSRAQWQYSSTKCILLDIELHKLNWRFITIQMTQSGLYGVRGGAGELFSEVWRIVE